MPTTYFLFGDPDWYGTLIYALIFLACIGGFVFVVTIICVKVFGRRGADIVTINAGREEESGL